MPDLVGSTVLRENLNRDAIIALTNDARAMNGLPPLRTNPLLNDIAEARTRDMFEKQYFAHVSPTGQQVADIAQIVSYHYKRIAENIGSGDFLTNQKIIDNWMQSPGHRANILDSDVEEIGAAVMKGRMKGRETYVAVQIFGLQSPSVAQHAPCVAPSKNLLDEIELKKAEIEGLNDQLRRMKQEFDAESASIETDRKYTYDDQQKIQSLNVRIAALNEKKHWYLRVMTDVQAKSIALKALVDEYNRMVQAYNACSSSAR
ncbi:MAG: CAP domain-containing protein [Deltaproteobacteria bacterium]|nr:CAP domain-containing protein [Deltaproteobacteria bacterium]